MLMIIHDPLRSNTKFVHTGPYKSKKDHTEPNITIKHDKGLHPEPTGPNRAKQEQKGAKRGRTGPSEVKQAKGAELG